MKTQKLMIEVIERSRRKVVRSESRRISGAKLVLAATLAIGLSGCSALSRDSRENRQQIAAQITAGEVEVIERERVAADNRSSTSIPSTLAEARSVFLDHSPIVQDRLLAYEITLSDINQNEGGYSNPTLALGRFTGNNDPVRRLLEVGFSLIDLVSLPSANRALDYKLASARSELELNLYEGLVQLDKAWVIAGVSQAKLELKQHQVMLLDALLALSAEGLVGGTVTEAEHESLLQGYFKAQGGLDLASAASLSATSELGQLLGLPHADLSGLSVPIWSAAEHAPMDHTSVLEVARATNRHLRSLAAQIPIADNARDQLQWARWIPGLGVTLEIEEQGGTQRGPKLEWEMPVLDTQANALSGMSKRSQQARDQVAFLERDIEFGVARSVAQANAAASVIKRLEKQILPLQRQRLNRWHRDERGNSSEAFDLAQGKIEMVDNLWELLDMTERYWLARIGLVYQSGVLLNESEPLLWRQFLPAR